MKIIDWIDKAHKLFWLFYFILFFHIKRRYHVVCPKVFTAPKHPSPLNF